MKTRFGFLGVGIVVGIALMLVGWQIAQRSYRYQGSLIDPPLAAPDFALNDQSGSTFRLSDQRGKIVLIFFGYTNCPDVCPLTMANYRQIKSELGAQAEKVEFVLITVDPERDTPERLQGYVSSFDPQIIGLSGSLDEMQTVWESFGVYRAKVETGSASGYAMDHSARMYLIDPAGNWRLTYPYGFENEKIIADLQHLLREAN